MIEELQTLIMKELESLNKRNLPQDRQSQTPQKQSRSITPTRLRLKTTEESTCSFRPMLCRKSLKLAEKLGDPTERLTKIKSQKQASPPLKSKRSISNTSIAPRWEQLYTLGQFYQTKKEALRTQLEFERSKENIPTFHPDVSKSQQSQYEFSIPFEERNKHWEQRKQERIQQQQMDKESHRDCSFQPTLIKAKKITDAKVTDFNKRGLIQYFERVQLAQKKNQVKAPVSKWKNQITIPKEFNLSKRI